MGGTFMDVELVYPRTFVVKIALNTKAQSFSQSVRRFPESLLLWRTTTIINAFGKFCGKKSRAGAF